MRKYINSTREKIICSHNGGAVAELEVAADLLRRGFWVYRAVSPAGPFDLCVYKHRQLLRIEVTTSKTTSRPDREYDLLAVVEPERIKYISAGGYQWDHLFEE